MDHSDVMNAVVREVFTDARITIDCFHTVQIVGDAIEGIRMQSKREAVKEEKKEKTEFKKRLQRNAKKCQKYAEKHQLKLYEALQETLKEPLIASSKAAEFVKLIESYKQAFQLYKLTDLLTGLMNDSGYEAMLRLSGEDDRLNNLAELKQSIFYYHLVHFQSSCRTYQP